MGDLPKYLEESLRNSKAEYRRLGKSGLYVSVPIFGTMGLGSSEWAPWVLDEDKALPLLKAAYDRGINTWDTANSYSNGASEEIIGKAIKKYDIPREKIVIMTKCHGVVNEHDSSINFAIPQEYFTRSKDYVNQFGLSRRAIFSAVEKSLKRLQTDYIDLLQIHRYDYNMPIEETMKALHDLVESGKVRYIGASSMWAYQFATMQFCAEKNNWTKFISMQNQYSLLYREEEREMNRFCNETGVGLVPWSPLERGFLARPLSRELSTLRSQWVFNFNPVEDSDQEIIRRVEEIAQKRGWKMSEVAIAWIKKRVSSPIIGFNSVDRIEEALSADGKTLTEDEEKYLEEPYKPKAVYAHS